MAQPFDGCVVRRDPVPTIGMRFVHAANVRFICLGGVVNPVQRS
jgi:hypothetical protein